VALSGTLYLPPGYAKGVRLPLVMWAYPREFTDPAMAGQVSGSPYRFTTYTGASHLFFTDRPEHTQELLLGFYDRGLIC
jgi:dipeptidyl aminopeptidase/acylaminoacyl peptidase